MALLQELDLSTYNQFAHGKKLMQIGRDSKIRSFTGDIPKLSWLALIDLHFFIVKVLIAYAILCRREHAPNYTKKATQCVSWIHVVIHYTVVTSTYVKIIGFEFDDFRDKKQVAAVWLKRTNKEPGFSFS